MKFFLQSVAIAFFVGAVAIIAFPSAQEAPVVPTPPTVATNASEQPKSTNSTSSAPANPSSNPVNPPAQPPQMAVGGTPVTRSKRDVTAANASAAVPTPAAPSAASLPTTNSTQPSTAAPAAALPQAQVTRSKRDVAAVSGSLPAQATTTTNSTAPVTAPLPNPSAVPVEEAPKRSKRHAIMNDSGENLPESIGALPTSSASGMPKPESTGALPTSSSGHLDDEITGPGHLVDISKLVGHSNPDQTQSSDDDDSTTALAADQKPHTYIFKLKTLPQPNGKVMAFAWYNKDGETVCSCSWWRQKELNPFTIFRAMMEAKHNYDDGRQIGHDDSSPLKKMMIVGAGNNPQNPSVEHLHESNPLAGAFNLPTPIEQLLRSFTGSDGKDDDSSKQPHVVRRIFTRIVRVFIRKTGDSDEKDSEPSHLHDPMDLLKSSKLLSSLPGISEPTSSDDDDSAPEHPIIRKIRIHIRRVIFRIPHDDDQSQPEADESGDKQDGGLGSMLSKMTSKLDPRFVIVHPSQSANQESDSDSSSPADNTIGALPHITVRHFRIHKNGSISELPTTSFGSDRSNKQVFKHHMTTMTVPEEMQSMLPGSPGELTIHKITPDSEDDNSPMDVPHVVVHHVQPVTTDDGKLHVIHMMHNVSNSALDDAVKEATDNAKEPSNDSDEKTAHTPSSDETPEESPLDNIMPGLDDMLKGFSPMAHSIVTKTLKDFFAPPSSHQDEDHQEQDSDKNKDESPFDSIVPGLGSMLKEFPMAHHLATKAMEMFNSPHDDEQSDSPVPHIIKTYGPHIMRFVMRIWKPVPHDDESKSAPAHDSSESDSTAPDLGNLVQKFAPHIIRIVAHIKPLFHSEEPQKADRPSSDDSSDSSSNSSERSSSSDHSNLLAQFSPLINQASSLLGDHDMMNTIGQMLQGLN